MSNLANYTSFQGVLDTIIRSYLLNELPPEVGESSNGAANIRHSSAERDLNLAQTGIPIPPEILRSLRRTVQEQGSAGEVNNNDGQLPGTSASGMGAHSSRAAGHADQEYIKALHQCFEKRGVFKELQTFLRHKLVSILQDEFPSLQQSFEAKDEQNIIVFRLIEDFLRCHKLLYTLSVLASESDVKQQHTRVLHGKLSSKEAEDLLDELGISRSSRLSGQVLKCYFDNEHFSLLESMHYLGIWLDGASSTQPLLETCQGQGKRKGSGQSIILTKSNNANAKQTVEKGEGFGRESTSPDKENIFSVESRLIDLERKMEKENDLKMKRAIERFKSEEIQSLRENLEQKMQLQLIEKEKEHLSELQAKLTEINQGIHQERQGWFEEKLRQEKELCELRKQLVTKTRKDISNSNIQQQLDSSLQLQSPLSLSSKSCQVSFKEESRCNCNCRSRKKISSSEEEPDNRRSLRNVIPTSSSFEYVQQDKIAFLQYRLEQQDEEMKSLRRQLMVSQHQPSTPSTRSVNKPKEPRREGRGDAEEISPRNRNADTSQEEEFANEKVDDLAVFLRNTRKRMEKLDVAASKVDEIVQEVFAKNRAATPLSSELLSACLSSARKRKTFENNSSRAPGIYNVSPQLLSPMTISAPRTLAPLSHQQLPEKQVTFISSELKNLATFNNFDIFHRCQRQIGGDGEGPTSYIAPASSIQMFDTIMKTPEAGTFTMEQEQDRPQTPLDKQFPVAYGQRQQPAFPSTSKQADPINETNDGRDSKLVTILKAPPPVPGDQNHSSPEASSSHNVSVSSGKEQVEESLFHMALRNMESRSPPRNSSTTNLKEKALRHGALSKEKVVTSDDDKNSKSISVSESIKLKLASKSRELAALRNNNGQGSPRTGAISKSKVKENRKEFAGLPEKVEAGPSHAIRRQSQSSQNGHHQAKLPSSSSSSSHNGSRKNGNLSARQTHHRLEQDMEQNDLSVSSISISAPKSENDGNFDDFWKL